MSEILKRIIAFNAAKNAIQAAILPPHPIKDLTPKQAFHHFSTIAEDAMEQKLVDNPPVKKTLAQILAEKKNLPPIAHPILDKVKAVEAQDDLGAEVKPLPASAFTTPEHQKATIFEVPVTNNVITELPPTAEELKASKETFSLSVVLNERQLLGKEMAFSGKSFCFIGPAGSGKTTGQREIAKALLQNDSLSRSSFKYYNEEGERKYVSAPSIAFCAFTRRATGNLAKAIHKDPVLAEELKYNIMTVHSLLEFEPETYMEYNPETGETVEKFRFSPQRTAVNPLTITHLVIEESSQIDAAVLWKYLYDALPCGVQIIFIGDINQLPPVFGPSILNYALTQLPVVELTEVYRNQGIVLDNAHRILKGQLPLLEDKDFKVSKNPQFEVGQAKLSTTLGAVFNQLIDGVGTDGLPDYSPDDCIILSPFNKQECGTDNLNSWIAQHLGTRRGAIVHEVIAGFEKHYLAEGDRVMVNRLDGVILKIERNPNYYGKEPQYPGTDLSRHGFRIMGAHQVASLEEAGIADYSNFSLASLEESKAERKAQASHRITVQMDNGKVEIITSAGDLNGQSFSLGYCLTVHKAQGSEWRKVFIVLHKDHAVMLYRELFYTAVTRAKTKVTIIATQSVIEKAVMNQRIKGQTIKDKIEFFNQNLSMDKEPVFAYK